MEKLVISIRKNKNNKTETVEEIGWLKKVYSIYDKKLNWWANSWAVKKFINMKTFNRNIRDLNIIKTFKKEDINIIEKKLFNIYKSKKN